MIELHATKELIKTTHSDTQNQNYAHPQKQSYRLRWGAADKCKMPHGTGLYPYHNILWTIQLKYTIETKQERTRILHYMTHRHGHTNSWYVYVSYEERISFT